MSNDTRFNDFVERIKRDLIAQVSNKGLWHSYIYLHSSGTGDESFYRDLAIHFNQYPQIKAGSWCNYPLSDEEWYRGGVQLYIEYQPQLQPKTLLVTILTWLFNPEKAPGFDHEFIAALALALKETKAKEKERLNKEHLAQCVICDDKFDGCLRYINDHLTRTFNVQLSSFDTQEEVLYERLADYFNRQPHTTAKFTYNSTENVRTSSGDKGHSFYESRPYELSLTVIRQADEATTQKSPCLLAK